MSPFSCPHCDKHSNAIGIVFPWNKAGRSRFKSHMHVFHPLKNVKQTIKSLKVQRQRGQC